MLHQWSERPVRLVPLLHRLLAQNKEELLGMGVVNDDIVKVIQALSKWGEGSVFRDQRVTEQDTECFCQRSSPGDRLHESSNQQVRHSPSRRGIAEPEAFPVQHQGFIIQIVSVVAQYPRNRRFVISLVLLQVSIHLDDLVGKELLLNHLLLRRRRRRFRPRRWRFHFRDRLRGLIQRPVLVVDEAALRATVAPPQHETSTELRPEAFRLGLLTTGNWLRFRLRLHRGAERLQFLEVGGRSAGNLETEEFAVESAPAGSFVHLAHLLRALVLHLALPPALLQVQEIQDQQLGSLAIPRIRPHASKLGATFVHQLLAFGRGLLQSVTDTRNELNDALHHMLLRWVPIFV
mmetsp:Transcript_58406/g.156128  ORF Transcript_58406/g.156128 Transcript_58406/m.156128 type:complete len:348 (+) Transcript_58406:165-1208(+)